MTDELIKIRDENADTVSRTAAKPMLRDMLSMSRGEFKDNLEESYKWGFDAAWELAMEMVGPVVEFYSHPIDSVMRVEHKYSASCGACTEKPGTKARELKEKLGL